MNNNDATTGYKSNSRRGSWDRDAAERKLFVPLSDDSGCGYCIYSCRWAALKTTVQTLKRYDF